MSRMTEKFVKLKTGVAGNREQSTFEWTIGMTPTEKAGVTGPGRANRRVLAEVEYLMHLSEVKDHAYDGLIEEALDYLLDCQKNEGVLTNSACEKAEEMLMPLADAAKEYKVILAAHAHIDMNWMWSYQETVAITLATFRSILNIMNEYPDFCFSQSQASVYKIVEEHDPEMMEEIKARIAEGRWEVTATAWVETDKNMPSGESLLRHIEYTKDYLKNVWGAKRLDIDFSPDTFGHSANVPEINTYSGVKYYYHCRGLQTDYVLYRFQAPSGSQVLVHREHNWYNSGITPHIGIQAPKISERSAGLKTGLIVYGVGDHGGGPTRRDVERALEMMEWKLFPQIRFGTLHEYFDEAASKWDELPIIDSEMNFIFQGCYTTQSRVKRGNRRTEAALQDAEQMSVIAGNLVGFPYAKEKLVKAWQDVLFTHFHDILTGSCTQDSREYAMALYQSSIATANTQIQNAMRKISLNVDTSSIQVDIDGYNSQSEGAGVGFGVEHFIGVANTERGSGRTRIFHVFNTLPFARKENIELSVWDWTGNMKQIRMKDHAGNPIPFQLVDQNQLEYWEHRYFRILAQVEVPAMGYTTIVLSEAAMEEYPVHLNEFPWERKGVEHKDLILENAYVKACINRVNGRIVSLVDKVSGREMIASGKSAGFTYLETQMNTMSAWTIGRYLKEEAAERCVELKVEHNGVLRQSVKAVYQVGENKIEVLYILDKNAKAVKMDVKIDWHSHGVGKDMIPSLDYRIPVAYDTAEYMYDIPTGSIRRKDIYNDVPALQYGMAVPSDEKSGVILISDCKYGYRGEENTLAVKLINAAIYPDPYPERGIHTITLWIGVSDTDAKKAEEMANTCTHSLLFQPSNCHEGKLPMEQSVLKAESKSCVISAVVPQEDGSVMVRAYETAGQKDQVQIVLGDKNVTLEVEPYSIRSVVIS